MAKKNCWEFHACERQPGGDRVAKLGECPATGCFPAHGIHDGINGGRVCWTIAGSFCRGVAQGSYVDLHQSCANCDFFHAVAREEGFNMLSVPDIISKMTLLE